ncbi:MULTISPECIES: GntR family transcriptional regulator [Rhodococcus]|uniref:GntR family transcriptional regulator n=1 Tax=Rhodococcus opacus RKJ300 = JCM 13270 TaxID=1165867 RepID=I0WQY9_RHOOP|nr:MULTISPECIES: GntR family transcriptional regulator [Rhodococcus]EID78805.1 GntR family transcriptional regulator [Rhodococcus opacus RKJ300 = JCM 13270]QQZ18007.1 GntR family transcriptional regulator [Rhodococcus sp. 21391]
MNGATDTSAPKSLRETAYEELRRRIVNLQLAPGQRLIERDLAAELQVSRIPLREALQQLQTDGLVVIVPRRGAIVAPFGVDEVRDLFDVRESLEVLAARLAAQRADDSHLTALRDQLTAARSATARDDKPAIAAANAAFHAVIVEMSGSPLLQSMLQPLATRVQWLFHLTKERDPGQQCDEHAELYEAIAAGDTDRAAEIAYRHVASGREPSLELAEHWSAPAIDPVEATRTRQRTPRRKDRSRNEEA